MTSPSTAARLGLLQISLAGVLWGTGGLAVQLVRERVPMHVVTISAWRMVLAGVVLAALLLALRGGPVLRDLLRTHPRRTVVVGASTAAYQALYFGAVTLVGVSVATVVSLGLAPVLLTAAEAVRGRRLPGRGRTLVLVAALAGLVLVTVGAGHGGGGTGPEPLLGVLAACGSGAAYAFATAQGEVLARSTGPLALTTATTGVGALLLVPAALLVDGPRTTADPQAVALLVYLGVVTMALAYGLLYAGLRTSSGSAATIATLLEPVTAAAVAALVLDERIGLLGLVGTALVLLAVAGLGREEPAAGPPPP
ncbi:EamA family transporter [Nocardioides ginkgobilobae]